MGNKTTYTYTDNGLLATTTKSNASGTSHYGATVTDYAVDAANRNTGQVLDPSGIDRTTTVSYNPDDLPAVTAQTSPAGATEVTSQTYDPMGNLTSRTVYSGAAGQPAGWWPLNQASGDTVQDESGTGHIAAATDVTWASDGNKTSVTGPTGARTQYTYDYLDRMVTSTVLDRYPSPQAMITSYAYTSSPSNPDGAWLSSMTLPDGVQTSYGYNAAGEETSQTNGVGNTTSYHYDFLGRQTAVAAPDRTSQTVSYNVFGDPATLENLSTSGSSAALTRAARKRACDRSKFTTRGAHAGHCWPRSTFTRASRWRFLDTAG